MSKILVIGKNGQVGSNLMSQLASRAIGVGSSELDLNDLDAITKVLNQIKPDIVINSAAYNLVDLAEEEPERAYRINCEAPLVIAKYCNENNIIHVNFSTDFVFDGTKDGPYNEQDATNPLSKYGYSKAKMEEGLLQLGGKGLIFRVSWVYSPNGKNFGSAMIDLGKKLETLSVVNDQIGAPTYAANIAAAVIKAIDTPNFEPGLYNLTDSGFVSRYDFAAKIFEIARAKGVELKLKTLLSIPSIEFKTKAKRPQNSRLDCHKLAENFGIIMPAWQDGLSKYMEEYLGESN